VTSFPVEGFWFSPQYKKGLWDGRKRLLRKGRGSVPPSFPTGLLLRVTEELATKNVAYSIDDRRTIEAHEAVLSLPDNELGMIHLDEYPFDYQAQAVETMLMAGRGICRAATNAGKTEIGGSILASINQQGLWLIHRLTLAYQTRDRLAMRLGQEVGFIGDGICEPRKFTVAMVQSIGPMLKRVDHVSEFLRKSRVLIGDEVHHLDAKQWFDCFDAIPAAYRYGLSATIPEGDSGMLLEAQTGRIVFSITSNELIERGVSVPPRIWFVTVNKPEKLHCKEYSELYNLAIVFNHDRNDLIRHVSATLIRDRKPPLILVRRVGHCKAIAKMLCSADVRAQWITSEADQKKRNECLRGLSTGRCDAVVAMDSIMGEGVDCGDIRSVINATGGRCGGNDKQTIGGQIVQFLGRGMRRSKATAHLPEKKYFDYVDFVDKCHKDMRSASLARLDTLVAEGHGDRIGYWLDYSKAA
jgi:superfamily II DNA or RNA helicase